MQADEAPSAQVHDCLIMQTINRMQSADAILSISIVLQVVSLQIGDEVPNFSCESHMGVVNLHDYIDGGWGVILAFPKTEDPVACSQLG